MVTCPGDGVIRNRARCRQGDHWVDCYRDSCCPGYTLIVNKCIPDTEVRRMEETKKLQIYFLYQDKFHP